MIIKKRDSKESDIKELASLLSLPLHSNKRFLIERELRFVKSGDKGENDSAYFIDFDYGPSKNYAVIHDLRLEHKGRVAQIDHLLINRWLSFYLLESKNFSYGIKIIDDGQFLIMHNNDYIAIESPIEQNKRHIALLEKVVEEKEIMPTRLGLTLSPVFKSYVLISAKSRLIRPSASRFDTTSVIKADSLASSIDKEIDAMSPLSVLSVAGKICSSETVMSIAKALVKLHKPIKIDYKKRFGIEEISPLKHKLTTDQGTAVKSYYCSQCKKTITEKVARFCWDNKRKFGGKAYCFDCQKEY